MNPLAHSALIGGAVMTVIAASFALGRGPVHQLRDKPFQDALDDDRAILAAASDLSEILSARKVVQVETIKPEMDPLMMVLSEPSPLPKRRAAVAGDICSRHNMHKVWVTAKVWRCRR